MYRLSRIVILSVVLLGLVSPVCLAGNFPSEAISAAEKFIVLLDKQDFHTAYQKASELLRVSLSEQKWIENRERSKRLLGAVLERKLVSIRARDAYPGLPDGDYLVVYFEARTKRKQKAAEVLLVNLVSDAWQICSYRLK